MLQSDWLPGFNAVCLASGPSCDDYLIWLVHSEGDAVIGRCEANFRI